MNNEVKTHYLEITLIKIRMKIINGGYGYR